MEVTTLLVTFACARVLSAILPSHTTDLRDPPLTSTRKIADVAAPMMPVYERLIKKGGLHMAIMSGDDDTVCSTLGTQQFIWDLGLPVKQEWAPWSLRVLNPPSYLMTMPLAG